jgi:hypothetical protein
MDDYIGGLNYQGKRVLEFGTASGAVCFGLEQRGAEVIAFDLAPNAQWDIVPIARHPDLAGQRANRQLQLERLRNSFWLGHEATRSRSKVVHGSIYDVPASIGGVDVTVFGSILLHLRDPFLALTNGARLAREVVVVTDHLRRPWVPHLAPRPGTNAAPWWARARRKLSRWILRALHQLTPYVNVAPQMVLLPDPLDLDNFDTWWGLSPAIVQRFLALLGFENSSVTTHRQRYRNHRETMFTVVARRTQPMNALE